MIKLGFRAKVTVKASEKLGFGNSFISVVMALGEWSFYIRRVVVMSYFSLESGNGWILDTVVDRDSFSSDISILDSG